MNTNLDEHRKLYEDERRVLVESERDAAQFYDRAMLTLSGGALFLSMTFVNELAPRPHHTEWLFGSWVGFGVALSLTLVSYLISQVGFQHQRDVLDQWISSGDHSVLRKSNLWSTSTMVLNALSGVAFIFGAVLLAIFAGKNLP